MFMKRLSNYQKMSYFFYLVILVLFTGSAFILSDLNPISVYLGAGIIIIYSASFYALKLSNLSVKTKYLIKILPLITLSSAVAVILLSFLWSSGTSIFSSKYYYGTADLFIILDLFIMGVLGTLQLMLTSFFNKSRIEGESLFTDKFGRLVSEFKISNYKYIIADKDKCYIYFLKDKQIAERVEQCINVSGPRGSESFVLEPVDKLFSLNIDKIMGDMIRSGFAKAKETDYLIILEK
jgi:hypothetical protein